MVPQKLKRAGVLYISQTVLEYACPVWHHSITNEQWKQFSAVHAKSGGRKYNDNCATLELDVTQCKTSAAKSNARTYLCEFYIDLNIAYIICCPLNAINQLLAGFVLLRNFPGCLQELIHLKSFHLLRIG